MILTLKTLWFIFQELYFFLPVPQAKKEKLDTSRTTDKQISTLQSLPNTAKEDTIDNDEDTETEGETIEDSVEDSYYYKFQCNA